MTATTTSAAVHEPPAGVRLRGALALVAGAGETAQVYQRFGRRLATDGYRIGVFGAEDADAGVTWLAAQDATPRILAGSDRGAIEVLAVDHDTVDGLLLAGLPATGRDDADAAADERTACPVHLGVLQEATNREPSRPDDPASLPSPGELAAIRVPVLAIHGGADAISPLPAVREALRQIPSLELVETVGGLHDALNDQSHRSVAATIVLWLERLRLGGVDAPIVREVAR